ncbi:MAG: hypothetical protein OYH77_08925 [Pseudomonadota bacterium]|nr:hypothetical protein [Pseudomonadota bacterium]
MKPIVSHIAVAFGAAMLTAGLFACGDLSEFTGANDNDSETSSSSDNDDNWWNKSAKERCKDWQEEKVARDKANGDKPYFKWYWSEKFQKCMLINVDADTSEL